jgi:hypothetical protein
MRPLTLSEAWRALREAKRAAAGERREHDTAVASPAPGATVSG